MIKKIILTVLLGIYCFFAYPNAKTDSLYNCLNGSNDSSQYVVYDMLYEQLINRDIDSTLTILNKAIHLAQTRNEYRRRSNYENLKGKAYSHAGQLDKAIQQFEYTYNLAVEHDAVDMAVMSLNNSGTIHLDNGEHNKASQAFFEALKLAEEHQLLLLQSTLLNNIGKLYFYQED